MINPFELKIGNKINAFYDDSCIKKGVFIETVANIQQKKIMTLEDQHWVSIDNYSPILLTKEVLNKLEVIMFNHTCQYLHELQNLFFDLMGKELKIIL